MRFSPTIVPLLAVFGSGCAVSSSQPKSVSPVAHEVPRVDAGTVSQVERSPWRVAQKPSLRSMTVALRVRPPQALIAGYEKLASRHRDLSRLMKVHSSESFGSGFVVVHESAQSHAGLRIFVVTNQHVVGLSESAEVEFLEQQESYSARVVYVDEVYDLAILELSWNSSTASTPPIEAGFGFAEHAPRDQDAIVAVGYPGIAGEPSYQVTRGYVSNERVYLPIDGSQTAHVQHTAPIDPGSSGGPLLDESARVLGINTLKIRNREGVGLAVPAADIEQALERALQNSKQAVSLDSAAGQAACLALLKHAASDGYQAIERSLSIQFTAELGADSLGDLPEDGTDWAELFYYSPGDVFLHALAHRLKKAIVTQEGDAAAQCIADSDGIFVQAGPHRYRLGFVVEQSRLKLNQFKLPQGEASSFLRPKQKSRKKWSPSLR